MLINGRPFAVSTERFDILRRMCPSAGTSPLLSEFRPVRFPYDADIWQLLYKCSYSQGICCFLAGQFVLYMAGTFQTFNAASLFITLLATPLSAVTRTFGHFLLQRIPLCIFGSRRWRTYLILRYLARRISYDYCHCQNWNHCLLRPHFKSRFRTVHLVKLRTIHFRQILSNLYSPRRTGHTQTSMSNTLQGGIRRVEKRHTLPRVSPAIKPTYDASPTVYVPTPSTVPVSSVCGSLPPY